jgi:hypothetical protein
MATRKNELLAAALSYAQQGRHIFPCRPRGKEPLTEHGFYDATVDGARIIDWWTRSPDANVAMRTGKESGVFVLDEDPAHGGTVGIELLEADYGSLPETVEAVTGGGGRHLFFQHPGVPVKNSVSEIAPGIDIRGDGGYVILPPSCHPSGNLYEWEITNGPNDCPIAPAPSWLLEKIRAPGIDNRRLDTASELHPIFEGQRNETLFKLACSMRNRGCSEQTILSALLAENTERCRPSLTEQEVIKIAKSAGKYKARTFKDSQDIDENELAVLVPSAHKVEPFPAEVLPTPMRQVVEAGARALHCPTDYIAVSLLSTASAAIGTTRVVEIKRGWKEGCTLFTATVASPGAKKSPALKLAADPLFIRQRDLNLEFKRRQEEYETEHSQYEIDLAEWKRKATKGETVADDKPKEPKEPRLDQVFTTDATLEALADLLEHSTRGVLYLSDELAGWARGFNQYKAGRGADRQTWLSFWNASQVIVNRKNRKGPIVLNSPFVSVTGCLQPDILSELSDEKGREDGFVHRILFAYPDPTPGAWTEYDLDPSVLDTLKLFFKGLWELKPDQDAEGNTSPVVLHLTPAAKDQWRSWITGHYKEQTEESFAEHLKGPWAKMEGYCARLALIIHCCRLAAGEVKSEEIDEESVLSAWALVDYFKSHARKVYAQLRTTPADTRAQQVLKWIEKRNGKASTRDLLRANVGGIKTASEAKRVIAELVDRAWGKIEKDGKREFFILNQPDTRQFDENEGKTNS